MIRVLLVADTHLGFDLPARPRVERRRRGPDFFANFERALAPALRGEVDLVVHGGDLLYRSRVPASLVQAALQPLRRVAEAGVPVYVVPGNHERSRIPVPLLSRHPLLNVFDRPRTFVQIVRGETVALSGWPFAARCGGSAFAALLAATGWRDAAAGARLLCLHQAVEGATVGPADFTFRAGADVVAARDLPAGFAAVLTGHIHRRQVLTLAPGGAPLAAPVLYPGSIERTSFAERDEPKGYLLLELDGGRLASWRFVELPARPMSVVALTAAELGGDPATAAAALRRRLAPLAADAVVQLRLDGALPPAAAAALSAPALRALAPPTMEVSLALPRG